MPDEPHANPTPPPADEMIWASHYVRDAIQELRQDLRALREELRSEIASVRTEIAQLRTEMYAQLEAQRREANTRFYWLIGIMVTLAGMQSALMVALFKM